MQEKRKTKQEKRREKKEFKGKLNILILPFSMGKKQTLLKIIPDSNPWLCCSLVLYGRAALCGCADSELPPVLESSLGAAGSPSPSGFPARTWQQHSSRPSHHVHTALLPNMEPEAQVKGHQPWEKLQ